MSKKNSTKYLSFFRLFILFISLPIMVSCSKSEDIDTSSQGEGNKEETEQPVTPTLTTYQRKVIHYFKEIALGFEFGNSSKTTRKWVSQMNIYVYGNPTEELTSELNLIVNEINSLVTDGFQIEIVDNKEDSNYEIFFGSYLDYIKLYPNSEDAITSNWGYFDIKFNTNNELTDGAMYVDMDRPNLTEQKHLLREELTQSLGLAQDSAEYSDSIFQIEWTDVNEYSKIDKELIHLLYHPVMEIGLDEDTVEDVLIDILLSE